MLINTASLGMVIMTPWDEGFNARGCQDFSYSLKIRLMHFYINTLPLGVSFPNAIEFMLITPIFFELCPILCFDLGVFNNFGVFINTKESNKVNLL